jgi:putative oxygen-independent coproporphyrinogen III oxidase
MIPIIPAPDFAPLAGEATASGLTHPPPLSLYIHIPWCVRKCPYCDFNSHESRREIPEQQYVAALIADLEQSVPKIWGRKLHSIFFGGGTPSLFSPDSINKILNAVRMLTPLEYGAEITLEANPGTVDVAHFQGYRDAGINRVSLGIQSFDNRYLLALGRIHDQSQAIKAAEIALATFDSVNLDVMYALPGQSLQDALADARRACDLNPTHLSFYHLTLEPNTPFHRTPPSLPDDDAAAAMQETIENIVSERGYDHYETSAFAKPGRRCRHNLNYWQFGDYLGIGAGAHSKLSYHDRITREVRHKHPNRYLEKNDNGQASPIDGAPNAFIDREWTITQDELGFEFMMNALRLTEGFEADLFEQRTGLHLRHIQDALKQAGERGLLKNAHGIIQPTMLGQRFLNELLQLFLP